VETRLSYLDFVDYIDDMSGWWWRDGREMNIVDRIVSNNAFSLYWMVMHYGAKGILFAFPQRQNF
jgi:hypothetical protein